MRGSATISIRTNCSARARRRSSIGLLRENLRFFSAARLGWRTQRKRMSTWRAVRPLANWSWSHECRGCTRLWWVARHRCGDRLALARDGFDVVLTYVSQLDQAGDIVSAIELAGLTHGKDMT